MSSENALHLWVCVWHDNSMWHHLSPQIGMQPIQASHLDTTRHRFSSFQRENLVSIYYIVLEISHLDLCNYLLMTTCLVEVQVISFRLLVTDSSEQNAEPHSAVKAKSILGSARFTIIIVLVQACFHFPKLFLLANICCVCEMVN